MDSATEQAVLEILAQNNTLTIATVRPDGWPQATIVGYVNDEMTIYVMTFPQAQKVSNIKKEPRVSLAIDHDESDWNKITGLSMAAHAGFVTDAKEIGTLRNSCWRNSPKSRIGRNRIPRRQP